MASSHQPYHPPNTPVGLSVDNVSTAPHPTLYQHWLDDAAQMGLMLYRMRNDSKRERMLRSHQRPPLQHVVPQPVPRPLPRAEDTPRRTAALQVPTVATQSTGGGGPPIVTPHPHHHPALHLPLD